MSVAAPAIGVYAPSRREPRAHRAARVVACGALELVAAGILLLGTAFPPSLAFLAAGVLHAMAALCLSGLPDDRPSRRWLCVAAVLTVPCVGVAVAAAVLTTRGRGSAVLERRVTRSRRRALTTAAVRHLGAALSPCDALDSGDEEQRRAALAALSRRRDPEAIALLRRAAAGCDHDLALSAALALDEIGERAERRAGRRPGAEVRYVAG